LTCFTWYCFSKSRCIVRIHRVGDCENDDALNRKVSPLFHVENIRAPLLIGQGANDPRVKQAESDQIVAALEAKKIPYEYIIYTDEVRKYKDSLKKRMGRISQVF
jgi:dienelactone hydrolase